MSLENVRAGDTLIQIRIYGQLPEVVTVDRVTKTQIIIGSIRYQKRTGFPVGKSTHSRSHIRLPHREGEIEKIRRAQNHEHLCYQIAHVCEWRKLQVLSLEALMRIRTVISTEFAKTGETDDNRGARPT